MFSHDSRLHRDPRLGMRGTFKDMSAASHYKLFFLSRGADRDEARGDDASTAAKGAGGSAPGGAMDRAAVDSTAVSSAALDATPMFQARRSTHFPNTSTADV